MIQSVSDTLWVFVLSERQDFLKVHDAVDTFFFIKCEHYSCSHLIKKVSTASFMPRFNWSCPFL